MKNRNLSKKMGLMVCSLLLASFVVALGAMHVFLSRYLDMAAMDSIDRYVTYTMEPYDSDKEDEDSIRLFHVSELVVDSEYRQYADIFSEELNETIIGWCRNNPDQFDKTTKADIDDTAFMIRQIPHLHEYEGHQEGSIYIFFVNLSEVAWMLRLTEKMVAACMLICLGIAVWFAYRMGKVMQEADILQKRFFENITHELKTPLMSIQGFAEGLQNGIISDTAGAYEKISNGTQQIAGMIDEILLLSKYDAKKQQLNKTELSVLCLVNGCLEMLEPKMAAKGIAVLTDMDDAIIEMDERQMRSVVSNISFMHIGLCVSSAIDCAVLARKERANRFSICCVGCGENRNIL